MSLLYLSDSDFALQNGTLIQGIRGYSLVLFYSPVCPHSTKVLPIYKQLPFSIQGCQFAVINVSQNRKVVAMSQYSNTYIEYVPIIYFYVNGQPQFKFTGALTRQDLEGFILVMSDKFKNRTFSQVDKPLKRIPEYCSGVPFTMEVTYLEFSDQVGYHQGPRT
jgi:hypothetical protein